MGFESASRSLCLQVIKEHRSPRDSFENSGCKICDEIVKKWIQLGLLGGVARCPAQTRAGFRCIRDPRPGLTYCASHSYLEQEQSWMYEEATGT